MTLQRFLLIAFLVFLLGLGVLYAGVNRVPFRNGGHHEQHKAALSTAVAAAGVPGSAGAQPEIRPANTASITQLTEQRS